MNLPPPDSQSTPTDTAPNTGRASQAAEKPSAWRLHRRVYDWVLHWADTPHGAIALFLLSFAESSFFPIPPDVLLIALVLGARSRWWRLALICTAGSVVGGLLGYAIGLMAMDAVGMRVIQFYEFEAAYEKVRELYTRYDFWIVFAAAFTPIPYKVFTITSGAMEMDLLGFSVVSTLGRGLRFFIVAALLYAFGPPMKRFIDRYFDLLSLAFVVLLVGGFVAVSYF